MATVHQHHPRHHIVLVPGFAGFDGLGQIEYYSGVTPLFRQWREQQSMDSSKSPMELHYFDNFPTARVKTRASKLRKYLVNKIARGEIQFRDKISFIGHSTGGLDIRRLIKKLKKSKKPDTPVDGAGRLVQDPTSSYYSSPSSSVATSSSTGPIVHVSHGRLFEMIDSVIFLSVPHYGTNIANWADNYRSTTITTARIASYTYEYCPYWLRFLLWVPVGLSLGDVGISHAVKDAVKEGNSRNFTKNSSKAIAREADSQLKLWLSQMREDLGALDDLKVEEEPEKKRIAVKSEIDTCWGNIRVKSYATKAIPPKDGHERLYLFEVVILLLWNFCLSLLCFFYSPSRPETRIVEDLPFRLTYRACAFGPFSQKDLPTEVTVKDLEGNNISTDNVVTSDNDCIVNTASMFWPKGDNVLVEGDHGDITGHFEERENEYPNRGLNGEGRERNRYDLLKSASSWKDTNTFPIVWKGVFDFLNDN